MRRDAGIGWTNQETADRRGKVISAAGTLTVAALLLAACAGEAGGGPDSESDASNGSEASEPRVLRVAAPTEQLEADPHGADAISNTNRKAYVNVYDTLVERRGDDYEPALATTWENISDTRWVFDLRDDVVFHDGSDLTAADVTASFERMIGLDGAMANLWPEDVVFAADGDYQVVIESDEPVGTMLALVSMLPIVPEYALSNPDFMDSPVGSGPFVWDEWNPGESLRLTAFDDHWRGRPQIDVIEYAEIPEVGARIIALETGEVDISWGVGPDQLPQLEEADNLEVEVAPSYKYYLAWFNASREPFSSREARRAMIYAVDQQAIREQLLPRVGQEAFAPIPEPVFGWSAQAPYEYNPEHARELLEEAGYSDGYEIDLQWNRGCCPNVGEIAATLSSYWSEVGIDVNLHEKERATWVDDLLALEWDVNLQDNPVTTGDADFTLARVYTDATPHPGYTSEELTGLLMDARYTASAEERLALYDQANEYIWENALGMFFADLHVVYVWNERVEGFEPTPDETPRFRDVTLQ